MVYVSESLPLGETGFGLVASPFDWAHWPIYTTHHYHGAQPGLAAASPAASSPRSSPAAAASTRANALREGLRPAHRALAVAPSARALPPLANLPLSAGPLTPAPPPHPTPSRPAPRRSPRRPPARTRLANAFAQPIARSQSARALSDAPANLPAGIEVGIGLASRLVLRWASRLAAMAAAALARGPPQPQRRIVRHRAATASRPRGARGRRASRRSSSPLPRPWLGEAPGIRSPCGRGDGRRPSGPRGDGGRWVERRP